MSLLRLTSLEVDRRSAILGGLAAAALGPGRAAAQAPANGGFGFDEAARLAADRAAAPWERRRQVLAPPFADLGYDEYRRILCRPEARLWRGEGRGFSIDFAPPGMIYEDRVALNVVKDGVPRPLPFRADFFHHVGEDAPLPSPGPEAEAEMAFSGFAVIFPVNRPDKEDELAVFQGASYFRAVGRGHVYGLSARGLAIGTGSPEGEEFPVFTDFWLHEPGENASTLTIHALLDSPSVAGAFEFVVRPGAETVIDTRVALFPRRRIETIGVAPLTSMYYFGPKDRLGIDDFRTAAHDSNGLQMITGAGERIWRPLKNPSRLQWSAFGDIAPKGFGLVQRAREFKDFEDAEARYERRPSCWVEPAGDWGEGAVSLVEIPTDSEFNDNIVAFWRPREPLEEGTRRDFSYRLNWCDAPPDMTAIGRVVGTRDGRSVNDGDIRHLVIDFAFPDLPPPDIEVAAQTGDGAIVDAALYTLPTEGRLRAALDFAPPEEGSAELRVALVGQDGAPISETWLYRWTAP